ncbi:MAG: response regulator [Chitinophagaceae bacterium]
MILIVDDNPENIFSLKRILELNQFRVDAASSGEEALKKILKNTYSLIILDVQMPGMDGFEVAEAVSGYSKSKHIPIIFLSAVNTEKRFITKGYSSGAIDYITKPFDPDILLLKVKTFVRLQEQAAELNAIHKTLREEIEFRKQAEKELQQSVQELRLILESIQQIAFTSDAGGNIEFVNHHWYQYSIRKETLPETQPGQLSVAACLQQAIDSGRPLVAEIRIKPLAESVYRFHLLSMTPVKQDKEIVKWVGIFTDIHQQRMVNQLLEQRVIERTQELQNANRELEASNHELQQFAYVASHDLKEPLRKIQVFSNLVRDKFLQQNPDAVAFMDRIIRSSERMTNLITDVLGYSELSITGAYEMTNLNNIISDIMGDMELLITEKKAFVEVDEIPSIEVIPAQMRQVFQNILSNALKFSQKDVLPRIEIKAELIDDRSAFAAANASGAYCRISVTDNGIGFNEVYLDRIFSIFQRLHSKEEYEGTGIGLAIVKKIVDNHNGILTARSKEGEGSNFIIVLPVKQSQKINNN